MPDEMTDRPSRIPWPPLLFAGCLGLALLLDRFLIGLPVPFGELGLVAYLGMVLLLAGGGLVIWAAVQFPKHDTSIRPDRGSNTLVLAGPFAFSRNPIYLGEALAMVGGALAFNKLWLLLVVPLFVVLVTRLAITREEAYLERRFGAAYLDYATHVRRWI